MKRKLATIAAIALLALTGCAGLVEPTPTATVTETAQPEPEETTESTPTESAEPEEKTRPTFGDTYTYPSGLSVKVGKPEEFTPSEYALKGEGAHLKFDITLTNDTGEEYDPVLFYASASSGDEESEQIFDGEELGGMPSTTVLDGKKVKFSIGFSVADPEDITMEVSPSFSFDEGSVIFTH